MGATVQSYGTVATSAVVFAGIMQSVPSGGATSMLIGTSATGAANNFLTTTAFVSTVSFALSATGYYFAT